MSGTLSTTWRPELGGSRKRTDVKGSRRSFSLGGKGTFLKRIADSRDGVSKETSEFLYDHPTSAGEFEDVAFVD